MKTSFSDGIHDYLVGPAGGREPGALPQDEEAARDLLCPLVTDPEAMRALRCALDHADAGAVFQLSDHDLVDRAAGLVASGRLSIVRQERVAYVYAASAAVPLVPRTATAAVAAVVAPPPEEKKIVDWRCECAHHAKKASRAIVEQPRRIDVVPEKGQKEDVVKIHYRDDATPPPPELRANDAKLAKNGASGAYSLYPLKAAYRGDLDQTSFFLPQFWRAFHDVTTYEIYGAPGPVTVRVFNPRQYKLELSVPPMRGFKAGAKFSHDVEVSGGRLARKAEEKVSWKAEASGWAPSQLKVTTTAASSDKGTSTKTKAMPAPVAFSVDDVEQKLDAVEAIGSVLEFAKSFKEIVESFRENVPKVGWYIDLDLDLLQGGLVAEWRWKEHTDHRAFQYVDVAVQLTILDVTLEGGFGVSGIGFKAQVFFQLAGELQVTASGRRESPDGAPGFAIPARTEITGTLGARFEAGNLFQAEGKGKTGIELRAELGINREGRDSAVSLDLVASWTGITVTATASGGLFGIGRKKTWKKEMASPATLGKLEWPKPVEFKPPSVSRDRIYQVMLQTMTEGLDVRVIKEVEGAFSSDERWTPAQIAEALTAAVDRHATFDRTPKSVEGLAHAIRADLDALGRKWPRDYVEEQEFRRYLSGPLTKHLDAMVDPATALAKSVA